MSTAQQIQDLQQEIEKLQGTPVPETLLRQLRALQSELQNIKVRPLVRRPRIPIIAPTPPDVPLNPEEMSGWTVFTDYLTALCQMAGEVNRDQWLHLIDVAADLTGSILGRVPLMGRTDGSKPGPGQIGEVIELLTPGWPSTTIPVTITAGTAVTWTSVVYTPLSAGDWDVSGYVTWNPAVTTTSTYFAGGAALSTVATGPPLLDATASTITPNASLVATPIVVHGLQFSSPTTVYVVTSLQSPITADNGKVAQAWGYIHARRMS